MAVQPTDDLALEFHTLTPERRQDLETLFGPRGACGGCWCMWWKLKRSEFVAGKGDANRKALKRIVVSGEITGLLAYLANQPVGWIAFAPREQYPTLARSRILQPVDEQSVWSVTCFFVAKQFRGKGIVKRLLGAAVAYVREQGGLVLEGYPVEPLKERMPDVFAYTGTASAFRQAGFEEVLRRSATRPIMRYVIAPTRKKIKKS